MGLAYSHCPQFLTWAQYSIPWMLWVEVCCFGFRCTLSVQMCVFLTFFRGPHGLPKLNLGLNRMYLESTQNSYLRTRGYKVTSLDSPFVTFGPRSRDRTNWEIKFGHELKNPITPSLPRPLKKGLNWFLLCKVLSWFGIRPINIY